ncbi:choice-of-anchor Q domain-containing protein [Pseudaeromonas paramecii]|uniref:Uncharacterized protein n=1 Tax=Pseudaeromonas paramecii TaxID=2138166 RepID=A0ABP8Q6W4_9GAMM
MKQWRRSILMGLLGLALAGCGGGGGESDGGGGGGEATTPQAAYTGNRQDAQLDAQNAGAYLSWLFDVQEVSSLASRRVTGVARSRLAQAKNGRMKVDEQLYCDSGQARLTGSLNDDDGRGTLTLVYQDCLSEGVTLNGRLITQYEKWDLNSGTLLDYTQRYQDLRSDSDAGQQTVNGSVQVRGEGTCDIRQVENLLMSGSDGHEVLLDGLTRRSTCYTDPDHPSLVLYRVGLSGQIYDGSLGGVQVSSSADYALGQVQNPFLFEISMVPVAGSLSLSSAYGKLTLSSWGEPRTASSDSDDLAYKSRLEFDTNGDGQAEQSLEIYSVFLFETQMLDFADSDQDGLFDGWERVNGSDPYRADADEDSDGDGVSNRFEYQLGTGGRFTSDYLQASMTVRYDESVFSPYQTPDVYVGQAITLPLTIYGAIDSRLLSAVSSGDLLIDLSQLGEAQIETSGPCQWEPSARQLRCHIDFSPFAETGRDITQAIGSVTITPAESGFLRMPVRWESALPIRDPFGDSNLYLNALTTNQTFYLTGSSRGYLWDNLSEGWEYQLQLSVNGWDGASIDGLRIRGSWSSEQGDLRLLRLDDTYSYGWQCDIQTDGFECEAQGSNYSVPTLVFAKPNQPGKTDLTLTVETQLGSQVNQVVQRRTLAYGVSTAALQAQLAQAEADGQTELVIPAGVYVGGLYQGSENDDWQFGSVRLKGQPGAVLWLEDGNASFYSNGYRAKLRAPSIEGLEIHGADGQILASEAIRDCHIQLATAYEPSSISAPLIEANHIYLELMDRPLFATEQDQLIRNNHIQVEYSRQVALFGNKGYWSSGRVQLVNNTLVDVDRLITNADEAPVAFTLSNNLWLDSPLAKKLSADASAQPLGSYPVTATVEHNLLPSRFSALAGDNLYTDTPGVLAEQGYALTADSPALDAGDAEAPAGELDLLGLPRRVGGGIDLGAQEYQTP